VLFSVLHTKKMPKSLPVIGSSGPTLQQVWKENWWFMLLSNEE
jgi:hypothetical protein